MNQYPDGWTVVVMFCDGDRIRYDGLSLQGVKSSLSVSVGDAYRKIKEIVIFPTGQPPGSVV